MTLLRRLIFLLGSWTVILIALLFWIYFFLSMLVFVLQWLSLHWGILIMLFSQFLLTFFPSYSQLDALFYGISYDYSCADWDELCDHLKDVSSGIPLSSVLLLLLVNFVSVFRLELMYISLIENTR